ncbi:hypothetical protein PV10_03965 [Exophiala mesophila]|uniref:Uncharacterized protein n=1 Tax=Exophiala mesophila TaxID=212818 RepID=A0A0D2A0T8_EXOME|nr:uncharacterized protein PV10_03965 [Exophiala mesophila]KIV92693.1 hypothetical protein PV10_03965 [Exophiala mesophila]
MAGCPSLGSPFSCVCLRWQGWPSGFGVRSRSSKPVILSPIESFARARWVTHRMEICLWIRAPAREMALILEMGSRWALPNRRGRRIVDLVCVSSQVPWMVGDILDMMNVVM